MCIYVCSVTEYMYVYVCTYVCISPYITASGSYLRLLPIFTMLFLL